MKVFDDFLKKVLDHNADEFPEVNDIVSRYKTLKHSNDKLKGSQQKDETDIEVLVETNSSYKKEQTTKMVKQGGSIASKQQQLEHFESEKERIIAFNEENSSKRMATTCEHGQILMTIDNLYVKVTKDKNCHELYKINNPHELYQKNFDNIVESEATSIKQLEHIKGFTQNFDLLRIKLKTMKREQREVVTKEANTAVDAVNTDN